MTTLSLRLNDNVFFDTEKVVSFLNIPRNKYINEALDYYNRVQKQAVLAEKLERESKLVQVESMLVLSEFEALYDEN